MHSAIIGGMSRLFILFLIALLPLRGWSVERMGVPIGAPAQMSAECALHMQMPAQASTPIAAEPGHAAQHTPDHKGCQSCQLCMPLAAQNTPAMVAAVAPAQAQPLAASSRFVSAEAARDAKPPIS